jgi:hypothetical protein
MKIDGLIRELRSFSIGHHNSIIKTIEADDILKNDLVRIIPENNRDLIYFYLSSITVVGNFLLASKNEINDITLFLFDIDKKFNQDKISEDEKITICDQLYEFYMKLSKRLIDICKIIDPTSGVRMSMLSKDNIEDAFKNNGNLSVYYLPVIFCDELYNNRIKTRTSMLQILDIKSEHLNNNKILSDLELYQKEYEKNFCKIFENIHEESNKVHNKKLEIMYESMIDHLISCIEDIKTKYIRSIININNILAHYYVYPSPSEYNDQNNNENKNIIDTISNKKIPNKQEKSNTSFFSGVFGWGKSNHENKNIVKEDLINEDNVVESFKKSDIINNNNNKIEDMIESDRYINLKKNYNEDNK